MNAARLPLIEPAISSGKPEGYYLLTKDNGTDSCVVYLYNHADFNGVRHVAFSAHDGSALVPVFDLCSTSVLIPLHISRAINDLPTDTDDLAHIAHDSP